MATYSPASSPQPHTLGCAKTSCLAIVTILLPLLLIPSALAFNPPQGGAPKDTRGGTSRVQPLPQLLSDALPAAARHPAV